MLKSSRRARRACAATLAALLMEGSAPPRLVFYDGDAPASPDQPVDQEILAVLHLRSPAFALDDDGDLIALPIDARPGLLSGMPTWARFFDGDGVALFDVDVGLPGSAADLILDRPVSAGGPVTITEFTISF